MDEILSDRLQVLDDEDFYKILGCTQLSSVEQIQTEYKKRVISCHPDKNLADPEAQNRFKKLQLAKDTLTDPTVKSKYDTWLNSGLAISWKDWLHHSNSHQMVFHWTVKKPDAMITESKTSVETNKSESNVRYWTHEKESPDELLKKFRSYQI